mgnify:FL=1
MTALLFLLNIKCINDFNKNISNVYFRNKQSLIDYINKLYSEL